MSKVSYLYLKKKSWIIQMATSSMPLISVTAKAHCTRSMQSKNLSGRGGLVSFGGTLSCTTVMTTVVKTRLKAAQKKAMTVFHHSAGRRLTLDSGTVIFTQSLCLLMPFRKPLLVSSPLGAWTGQDLLVPGAASLSIPGFRLSVADSLAFPSSCEAMSVCSVRLWKKRSSAAKRQEAKCQVLKDRGCFYYLGALKAK